MQAMSARAGRSFALYGAQDDTKRGNVRSVILTREDGEGFPDAGDERTCRGSFALFGAQDDTKRGMCGVSS